ncbi:MAG: CRTAC1 family protein [Bryobacteraceae bacterium]
MLLGQSPVAFEDATAASGIRFVLRNSASPAKRQIETMPGGVAALDYDGDGRPDLYFANGAAQPSLEKTGPEFWNRLYRNRGGGAFEDVTGKAGVAGAGYSMGVAAGDYNGDGHTDLFVAGVNRNILYRNRGDGAFTDETGKAGVEGGKPKRWSIAAGFFDFDGDGDLDLFVVNYVRWNPAKEPFCGDPAGRFRTYCHPKFYEPLPNQLYRNNGDGTFTDISAAAGVAAHPGKGMGIAFADYDGDGDLDVFVANDTVPNFLFRNDGDGRFREAALEAGVAFNDDGRALSSMGVDFRDYDNDGRADLFVTALANETFPLFRNLGKGLFADVTYPSLVGMATMALSGWGAGIYDFNNDGWKDLFAANGDVNDNTELFSSRASRQRSLVLVNRGGKTFDPVPVGGAALWRGAAFADFDGDGRVDIALSRLNEPVALLRNTAAGGHWLGVRTGVIGARVRVVTEAGAQWNHATTSVGYASASDSVVHFGLGAAATVKLVEIRWPSGKVTTMENVEADRYVAGR